MEPQIDYVRGWKLVGVWVGLYVGTLALGAMAAWLTAKIAGAL